MKNSTNPTWPAELTGLVTGIYASLDTLEALLAVCRSEGIRRHNYAIVIEFASRLAEESKTIYDNARIIRHEAPRRPGRPSKWVTVTENVLALAINLIDAAGDIQDNIPGNYWSTIAMLLGIMERTAEKVRDQLEQICLDAVPEVFLEALNSE